jgi:hypothetical protein
MSVWLVVLKTKTEKTKNMRKQKKIGNRLSLNLFSKIVLTKQQKRVFDFKCIETRLVLIGVQFMGMTTSNY